MQHRSSPSPSTTSYSLSLVTKLQLQGRWVSYYIGYVFNIHPKDRGLVRELPKLSIVDEE